MPGDEAERPEPAHEQPDHLGVLNQNAVIEDNTDGADEKTEPVVARPETTDRPRS